MKTFGPPRPDRVLLRRNTLYNRKRVGLATGNCGSSSSNAEVGSSQVYRQGIVNLAARKLGQKDLSDRKVMKTLPPQGNLMMQYHPKWKT